MDDYNNLNYLKNEIENLDKMFHIKIFDILLKNNIKYSENRNGIFVNMNSFDKKTINDIEKLLLYIKNQEQNLKDIENKKQILNQDYFSNHNKDSNTIKIK